MKASKRLFGLLTSLSLVVACSRSPETYTTHNNNAIIPETPVVPLSKDNCVRVMYDKTSDPRYPLGRPFAIFLLNLLGHFAEFQRHMSAIEDYKSGELDQCTVNFYLGTTFDNSNIPQAFVDDFKTTNSQVAWLGYNTWKLGASFLKDTFGATINATEPFTVLDKVHTIPETRGVYDDATKTVTQKTYNNPTFYKDVLYKGKVFPKYGSFGKRTYDDNQFFAAFEIVHYDYNLADVKNTSNHSVLAEVRHNYSNNVLPWAFQSENKFVFTEVPLSFVHAADRYFVFADLLFDILKAAPRHNSKPAVIRIEDVHPRVDITSLERTRKIFKQNSVTPHMSIVPLFYDPFDLEQFGPNRPEEPMTAVPEFMAEIDLYKADGTEFIWHGINHQLGNLRNPWEGTTGSDYEFWDFSDDVANNIPTPIYGRPVPGETPQSLIQLFKKGSDIFDAANVHPKIWLTPHYHGSSLSNYFFAQTFEWNIGRVVYYMHDMKGLDLTVQNASIKFPNTDAASWSAREEYLKNLSVDQEMVDLYDADGNPTGRKVYRQFGQMFPYEIYGDMYGQRLFPENLGNVEKDLNEQVIETRVVSQMLDDAARNVVLRDVWGSAFYHPYYLQDPYWTASSTLTNNDLDQLIKGLKALGYTFVNLSTFPTQVKNNAIANGNTNYTDKAPPISYH